MTLSFSLQWETADNYVIMIISMSLPSRVHTIICILVQHILPRPALISYLAPVLIGSNQILETAGNKAMFLVARLKVIAGVNDQVYCRLSLSWESLAT